MSLASRRQHFLQLGLRRTSPRLPARQLNRAVLGVHLDRHKRIAARLGNQRPVGPLLVVASAELRQALSAMLRMLVQPPIHLLAFERLMEPLQQAQLLRRAILNPHMAVLIPHEGREAPGDEARAIVGHQEGPLGQRPVQPLGFRAGQFQGVGRFQRAVAVRQMAGQADIDQQVLAVFDKMRVEDEGVRDWFRMVLASQTRDAQVDSRAQRAELQRQESLIVGQQDRLLNLRLAEDFDQETFARKHTEMRDKLASIKLRLDVLGRSHDETAALAAKVFELSQTLREQWLTADYAEKRRILEIVFLNCRLDDANLVPTMRKPFDVLAEGLLSKNSRGDWHSFELLILAFVDATMSPASETIAARQVLGLIA